MLFAAVFNVHNRSLFAKLWRPLVQAAEENISSLSL